MLFLKLMSDSFFRYMSAFFRRCRYERGRFRVYACGVRTFGFRSGQYLICEASRAGSFCGVGTLCSRPCIAPKREFLRDRILLASVWHGRLRRPGPQPFAKVAIFLFLPIDISGFREGGGHAGAVFLSGDPTKKADLYDRPFRLKRRLGITPLRLP